MNYIRKHATRLGRRAHFGQEIKKAASDSKTDISKTTYTTLGRILNIQKFGLFKVICLTGVHSLFFFGLPLVFQELSRLANMRVGEKMDKDSEAKSTEAHPEGPKEGSMADLIKGRPRIDYETIRAKITGNQRENNAVLSQEEIRYRYYEFEVILALFFGTMGVVGYLKHMRSRRLEDFYAILIKRKLYRELMVKDYSTFLAKDLNSTVIVQKINSNVNSFSSGLVDNINGIFRGTMLFAGGSFMMLTMLPKLSIMAAALVAVLGLSGKAFNSRIFDENKRYTKSLNLMSGFISDQMSNIQQVKMLGLKGRSGKAFDARLLDFHFSLLRVSRLWAVNSMLLEIFGVGGLCFILAEGCFQISIGQMPSESIWYVLFSMYVGMGLRGIIMNTSQLKAKLGMLQDTLSLAQDSTNFTHFDGRLKTLRENSDDLKLLHTLEDYFTGNDPYKLEDLLYALKNDIEVIEAIKKLDEYKTLHTYRIEFENVSFRYSQDSDFIFKNINCTFDEGVTHGIVSASGLGKTTFLNLAIGLLKPTTGRVLVNGEDLNSPTFDHAKMMSHTAYITQNTQMFMESILVNLTMGNLPLLHRVLLLEKEGCVTQDVGVKLIAYKLLDSLQKAQALQFVMGQEKGIMTLIGDRGTGLSGGQLQRLALARTLFRDPQLLLMDEATSALDKFSEKRVISHFDTYLKGKTSFVITHNQYEYDRILHKKHELADIIAAEKEMQSRSSLHSNFRLEENDANKENNWHAANEGHYSSCYGTGDSGKKRTLATINFEKTQNWFLLSKDTAGGPFNREQHQINKPASKEKFVIFDSSRQMEAEVSSLYTSHDSSSDQEKKISPFNPGPRHFPDELITPEQKPREDLKIDQKRVLPIVKNNISDDGKVTTIHRRLLYHILESEKLQHSINKAGNAMDIERSQAHLTSSEDRSKTSDDESLGKGSMCNELEDSTFSQTHSEPALHRNVSLGRISDGMDLSLHKNMSLNLDMEDQINHETAKWIHDHPAPAKTFEASKQELLIFDCRFSFEYLGGHIRGALSINKPSLVEFLFIKSTNHMYNRQFLCQLKKLSGKLVNLNDLQNLVAQFPNPQRNCTPVVIFHCEYSYCRAPEMYRFLRKKDREEFMHRYPDLTYPQIYLLKEGYSKFFKERSDLCATNSQHIMMSDLRFEKAKIEETRALSDDFIMMDGGKSVSSKRSRRFFKL